MVWRRLWKSWQRLAQSSRSPQTALLVPMAHRGDAVGVLAAFDRGRRRNRFTGDDAQLLRAFAASAATAVALAQTVQAGRPCSSLAAAEEERRRWARELHEERLQGLAALRALRDSDGSSRNWRSSAAGS